MSSKVDFSQRILRVTGDDTVCARQAGGHKVHPLHAIKTDRRLHIVPSRCN